jgi:hypothetical protein
MKRKAVLIESSDVKNHTELPGARMDIENWKEFLRSDLGGAWNDSEIVSLHKPFSSDVEGALKVDSDSYCFVAFSGHGGDGFVVLNDYLGEFAISSLKPKTQQGTVIIDSCRGVTQNYTIRAKMAIANEIVNRSLASARLSEGQRNRLENFTIVTTHRQSWEGAFSRASAGIVEMLACSKGQAAAEDPSAGGYYTTLLLQSAEVWEQEKTSSGIQTTKDAHDYAAAKLPPQQTPEYRPSGLAYPFAVYLD